MPEGVGYPPKMSPEAMRVNAQAQRDVRQALARAFGGSMLAKFREEGDPLGIIGPNEQGVDERRAQQVISDRLRALDDRRMRQPAPQADRQPSSRMQEVLQAALGQTDAALEAERRRMRRQQILNEALGIINQSELGRGMR